MATRASVIWFLLLVVAVFNGAFRESTLIPSLGQQTGHVVSTLLLCAGIATVAFFTVPWIRPRSAQDAILIGLGWLILTLMFEFGFGRLRGRSWSELLADYDVLSGRIWIFVLIVTALAPWLVARGRELFAKSIQ